MRIGIFLQSSFLALVEVKECVTMGVIAGSLTSVHNTWGTVIAMPFRNRSKLYYI